MQGFGDPQRRNEVSRALKALREAAGITQAELAVKLGTQQSFVSKYEAGERRLDVPETFAVCQAVDASFVELTARLNQAWSKRS